MTVLEFIDNNFPLSVLDNKEDLENRFGLPFPYTVPSPGDIFDCMFYWDTHFTNVGLIPSGRMQQAIYNTDNIRHMIQRFGYMPNGTKRHFLEKSQPPVYYRMVKDIFAVTKDTAWLERILSQRSTTIEDTWLLTVDDQDHILWYSMEDSQ